MTRTAAIVLWPLLAAATGTAQERDPAVRLLARTASDAQSASDSVIDVREAVRKAKPRALLTFVTDEEEAELVLLLVERSMAPPRIGTSAPAGATLVCSVGAVLVDRRDKSTRSIQGAGASWRLATENLVDRVSGYAEELQHDFLRRRQDWPAVRFEFEPLTKEIQRESGLKGGKALIMVVQAVGPAASAGLHGTDVVAGVDGKELKHVAELARAIYRAAPGTSLKLDVVQRGTHRTVTLVIP